MRTLFPNDFNFYPRTWTLPSQLDAFRAHCEEAGERSRARPPTYIVKPSGGSQGTGIYLVRSPEQLKDVEAWYSVVLAGGGATAVPSTTSEAAATRTGAAAKAKAKASAARKESAKVSSQRMFG